MQNNQFLRPQWQKSPRDQSSQYEQQEQVIQEQQQQVIQQQKNVNSSQLLQHQQINIKQLQKQKQLVQLLSQKNQKLSSQISTIERIMQQCLKSIQQSSIQNKKRAQLIQHSENPQILKSQLQNCYKKIKLYQYEIDKLKKNDNINQKLSNIQRQIKQKNIIQMKLKNQLNIVIKEVQQNSKKLVDNNYVVECQKQIRNKTNQVKFYSEMIKDYQDKDMLKQKNLKTQFSYIKKIQKQFIQNGGPLHQLQQLKQKAIKKFQDGRLKNSQVIVNNNNDNYHERFNKKTNQNQQSNNNQVIQQIITKQNYTIMCNQLKVLQKLNKKYEKQFQQTQNTIKQVQLKNLTSLRRVQRLQLQIKELDNKIKIKKSCILNDNLKPMKMKSKSFYQSDDSRDLNKIKKEITKTIQVNRNSGNKSTIADNEKVRRRW